MNTKGNEDKEMNTKSMLPYGLSKEKVFLMELVNPDSSEDLHYPQTEVKAYREQQLLC